jgi:hypothetical protein
MQWCSRSRESIDRADEVSKLRGCACRVGELNRTRSLPRVEVEIHTDRDPRGHNSAASGRHWVRKFAIDFFEFRETDVEGEYARLLGSGIGR